MSNTYLLDLLPMLEEEYEKKAQRAKYFNDPTLWAKEVLGVDLWYKQTEVANDLATGSKKSIAVRAGHGVGKSFLASILVCWWIDTRPINRVFVASTAPSFDQVSTILWREIRNMHALSHARYKEYLRLKEAGQPTGTLPDHPLPGYVTTQNVWKDSLGNVIGQGRKPPDNKEDAFQGIHAEYVLAIGDEACGLLEHMIDSLSNITSNAKSRRLLIGNPTNPRTRFGDIFLDDTEREMEVKIDGQKVTIKTTLQEIWSLHSISVLDSPNFHGGGYCECHPFDPHGLGLSEVAMASLSDQSYVDEKSAEYGRESARFKARVLGMFAFDGADVLFTEIILARGRDAASYVGEESYRVLGVDLGRSEDGDYSYVYSFTSGPMRRVDEETGEVGPATNVQGGQLRRVDQWRGVPLVDTWDVIQEKTIVGQATLVHQYAINLGAREVRVDSGGLGLGFIDGLRGLAKGSYKVFEMQSGGPTPDGRAWHRNRDFQMSQMAKRMREGLIDLDPTDRILIGQLGDITYEFVDPHGAMKIESKDSMKKRGIKSPDAADAAWYACADVTHLYGPQDGDVVSKTPTEILEEIALSGFISGYSY